MLAWLEVLAVDCSMPGLLPIEGLRLHDFLRGGRFFAVLSKLVMNLEL